MHFKMLNVVFSKNSPKSRISRMFKNSQPENVPYRPIEIVIKLMSGNLVILIKMRLHRLSIFSGCLLAACEKLVICSIRKS